MPHPDHSHHSRSLLHEESVEAEVIETEDLFLGAFSLARGGEIEDVAVRYVAGRRLAFFRISGPDMEKVEREYYGSVLVNLRLIKSEVSRLKSLAFRALRGEEMRDAGEQGRDRAYPRQQPADRGPR